MFFIGDQRLAAAVDPRCPECTSAPERLVRMSPFHLDQYEVEWQRADASMSVLDVNGVPYGLAPGNHDQSAAGTL